MAPTLTAEQQALVAALSPETIVTLLALAQAAGLLLKPAASTTSAIEPKHRAKGKPGKPAGAAGAAEPAGEAIRKSRRQTEETATVDLKKIKEERVFDLKHEPERFRGGGGGGGG